MSFSIFRLKDFDLRVFLEVGAEAVSDCAFFPEWPMKLGWAQGPCTLFLIWRVWATETAEFPPESRPSDVVWFWQPHPAGHVVKGSGTKVFRHKIAYELGAR